jgi:putative ABC transport system substrate-binding protein
VEILTEIAPRAALAILVNPRNPNAETEARDAQAAAQQSGRELRVLTASNEGEIDAAFATLAQQAGAALTIGTDTFFYSRPDQLVGRAAQHAIPTIYFHRSFGLAGGLITYGATFTDELRTAGRYAGRILAGEKPNNLPILQPSKFELVINLKTAKALGLDVPDRPARNRRRGDRVKEGANATCRNTGSTRVIASIEILPNGCPFVGARRN